MEIVNSVYKLWSDDELKSVDVYEDYVDIITTQISMKPSMDGFYSNVNSIEKRAVRKRIFVKDGKLHMEETYGKVIPPQDETYEFDESE